MLLLEERLTTVARHEMGLSYEVGGDQVIGVTFEHGENGEKGHLKGHAIRFTR